MGQGIKVHLAAVESYASPGLTRTVAGLLETSGCRPKPGDRVLVKPNLVAPVNAGLSCTDPAVVRAACQYLADCGAKIRVADSPAFATAAINAKHSGLTKALAGLPVSIGMAGRSSGRSSPVPGVAAWALEADLIVNLPRFKAHDQMLLTLGVKNYFGCLEGWRKPFAHRRFGHDLPGFSDLILDILAAVPPGVTLLDGITAMHKRGPARGEAFAAKLLAASNLARPWTRPSTACSG